MAEPYFFKLAGEVWEAGDGVLLGADVTLSTGKRASSATVELADPQLELANRLPLPTRQTSISFELFVGAGRTPKRLFSGFLSSLEPAYPPGRVKLMAIDRLKGARRRKQAVSRAALSIEQLAKRIAKEYGVVLDVSRAALSDIRAVGRVLQHGETDFELLERLCALAGHTVYVTDESLQILDDAAAIEGSDEALRLRLGENVRGHVKLRIVERSTKNATTIADYGGDVFEEGDEGAIDSQVIRRRTGVSRIDEDEPGYSDEAIASSKKALARAKKVFEASVTTGLEVGVRPHDVVTLEGYGERFDGAWRVDRVRHRLTLPQTTELELYHGGAD